MMFSRMAPTVLFTAFCVAVAGSYVTGERASLDRPGTPDAGFIEAMTAFSNEMALALQVGDHDRFRALLEAQVNAAGGVGEAVSFKRDVLPAPYAELRQILMEGQVAGLNTFLTAHPDLDLNAPQGRYGSVPLFWATANYRNARALMTALIEHGADPTFTTAKGYSLLHAMASPFAYALDRGDVDSVIAALPDRMLKARTSLGATAFHLALANGQSDLAIALLDKGADPNEPAPSRLPPALSPAEPPLIMAGPSVRLVEALLFAGADPLAKAADGTPILDAVTENAAFAEAALQDRVSASEAEEYDRQNAADYAKVRDMIRAAADGRLARGD